MKILNTTWSVSPLGTVGFVLTENESTGKKTLRCGCFSADYVPNEEADTLQIASMGGKISLNDIKRMAQEAEE